MANLQDLEKLNSLKEQGIISQQEFDKQKEAILKAITISSGRKSQVAYCVLALFLGQLGVHNFYVGRWKRGLAQLLLTLLFPLTLYVSLFISNLWAIINIFSIHTDAKGNEFEPSPVAKWVCGVLGIVWYVIVIGIISLGGIAGYTTAMRKHKANELTNYAIMVSVAAQTTDEIETPVDCSSLYPAPDTASFTSCKVQSDNAIVFDGLDSTLAKDLLKNGAKQDSLGNLYFQF